MRQWSSRSALLRTMPRAIPRAFFAAASFWPVARVATAAAPGRDRAPDPRKWAPAARSAAPAGGRRRPPKPWSRRRPGGSGVAGARRLCSIQNRRRRVDASRTRGTAVGSAVPRVSWSAAVRTRVSSSASDDAKAPRQTSDAERARGLPAAVVEGRRGRRGRPPPSGWARRTASSLGPCLKWCCRARGGRGARRYFCFTCFAGPAVNGALGSALRCAVE